MSKNLLAILLCIPVFALATEQIAVNSLTANGVTPSEAASLTDALRSELTKTGKYQVMERSQMEQILKEQGFQASGACDEATCAIEMGKLLAVNQIVMGNIGKVGKTYTLSARVVDVGTGKILQDITELHKGSIDGLLTDIIPTVTKKLTGTYKPPSKTPVYIGVGAGVAVAAAIPIIYFATKKKEPAADQGTNVRVSW